MKNWKVLDNTNLVVSGTGESVCEVFQTDDAKLMASAPELLEALKEVNKCLDNEFQTKDELIPDWIVQAYQVIGKAIKKAEG